MMKITRKLNNRSKKYIPLYALLMGILLSCGKKEKILNLEKRTLVETVYASGSIVPKNEYKVYALGDGIITKEFVKEGEEVKAGQALFNIKSETQKARLESAKTNLNIAEQNIGYNSPILNEAQIALRTAQIKFQQDSLNFIRYKNVFEAKAMSTSEFDKVKLTYELSRNELKARAETYRKIRNQISAEYQNALSQYRISAEDESNYLISSRIDGILYKVFFKEGELIRKSERIAIIGEKNQFVIELNIDETDIAKIKIGQEVWIKIDVFGDKIFKAKINKIYPQINPTEQSFQVDAIFEGEVPLSLSGLSVEANILIQKKEGAWVIPKRLLVGKDSVWVRKEGKKQKIKIQKGIENYDFVEIMDKLDAQTEILDIND
ncbi:MAG: efflux RND transporter periplasmic adaptor subunit [Thermonemataceae bacterium]|nr:efflux RND transporter periplasmic adaptor subunit [Thermonemataceae bacterium]